MEKRTSQILSPLTLWLLLCSILNAGGWLLSSIGHLSVWGYIGLLAPFVVASGWYFISRKSIICWGFRLRRFKRLFPASFAVVAILAVLGGALHGPANYDALAYRTPRVLHWLAEGHWHWIHTDFQRLNTRGNGIEWLTAPLLLFTQTDRLLFLINAISFLLLPGICFRLLSNLGVRKKVAWIWMWILPTGYCYALQAGSIANDLFGATLVFAAFDYALRATRERNTALACLSVLAAALMTSVKAFNLVLLLPWGLAMLPNIMIMLRRPLLSFATGIFALGISIVPTCLLNHVNCGDWRGIGAEPINLGSGSPSFHLGVNAILVPLHNLNPPVNPLAGSWNRWTEKNLPESWRVKVNSHFEDGASTLRLGEMQMEESTGLGFGISLLLLFILAGKHTLRRPPTKNLVGSLLSQKNLIPAGAAFAVIYFLAQSGFACPARYLAPFYVLLIAPVLRLPRAFVLTKSRLWRGLALLSFAITAVLVIIAPPRPLWPATTMLKALKADQSDSSLLKRVWTVYSVYGERSQGFQPLRAILPKDLDEIGLVTFDDPETSLWKPFDSLRIRHITGDDTAKSAREHGVSFVLVSEYTLETQTKYTLDEWLVRFDAEIVSSMELALRATRGPTRWHLVKLRPGSLEGHE